MERERDTTEQEESLLDNDKQPWLSFHFTFIIIGGRTITDSQGCLSLSNRLSSCSVVSLSLSISPSPMMMKVKWKEKETQLNKKKVC
jgi:hypothetical protein